MLWVKAIHIIFVVTWFAGIFYLPRLYVYHTLAKDEISLSRFCLMEKRLFYGIMTPSAILALIFGLWLLTFNLQYYLKAGWMHVKFLLVILLVCYHILCGLYLRKFQKDDNKHSANFFRLFNEIPLILLLGIVISVVVKPF